MSRVDLHLHTRYSDGSWTPDSLCREAARQELASIAVTDHDTLDGVAETMAAGQYYGVEVIPAVEVTCRVGVKEIHLLGYLPGNAWQDAALHAVLEHSKHIREKRVHDMVAALNELGIAITTADVFAGSDCGTVGRPHVALALIKRGVVRTKEEAFERFLKRGKPGFVERYRMEAVEAIGHLKRAGGLAVLAHPALNKIDDDIPMLVQQGLAGLEIWHSRHSAGQMEHYRKIAQRLELLVTGGSDCHGSAHGRILIGSVDVPYECVTALRAKLT